MRAGHVTVTIVEAPLHHMVSAGPVWASGAAGWARAAAEAQFYSYMHYEINVANLEETS